MRGECRLGADAKSPGGELGLIGIYQIAQENQLTFLNALPKLCFTGSAVSAATF
jgi:hypothetical protein